MRRSRRLRCALVVAAGVIALGARPAGADPVAKREGDITIVSAGTRQPMTHGGSNTSFLLDLPPGSTCPGDSANDDWRTQAFLSPQGTDPATLQYNAVGAVGPGVFPLYGIDTRSYRHELLEPNDKAGLPGHIPTLPVMSFATYPPDYVPPGRYVIGVACTHFHVTDKYWTVTVDVVKDAHDTPAQLTWSVVGAPSATSASAGPGAPFVVLVVMAVAMAAFFITRWSARRFGPFKLARERS